MIAGTWALAAGSNSVVKLLGGRVQSGRCRQVCWRHCAAVAVFKSNCEVLGLWLRAQTRSSSCLAAGYNRDGVVKFVGGSVQQLLCLKVIARYLGSGYGLILGRQAAWRPRTIGTVSSSWLAALCKQLLYLKVTARYLGSGCGLKLGRQAAWRPRTIGTVSSSWLAALCKQSLFSDCEVWLGLRDAAKRPTAGPDIV